MKTKVSVFLNPILQFGLVSGALFLVYIILLYVLEVNIYSVFFSFVSLLFIILFIVVPMVMGIKKINKRCDHPMNYGQKFITAFFIGLIGMVIYTLLFIVLFYYIDYEYMAGLRDQFLITMEERLGNAGMSEEMFQTQMARISKQMERAADPLYTLGTTLLSSVITPAITALIVAAAVNTRKHHENQVVIIEENKE